MARLSLFNSPLLLGFEPFEEALERISKSANNGYPPYNVEQLGENQLRITLAVAGFRPEDLEVQVQDNQLHIRGKQSGDGDGVFLHRGIAARHFHRSFVLADGIEITGAELDKGLLHVSLERPVVQPQIKNIAIKSAGSPQASQRKAEESAPAEKVRVAKER
jgi:HSP20 family molecular chaperone IbpA